MMRKIRKGALALYETLRSRGSWDHVVIHQDRHTVALPGWLAIYLSCGHAKGKLRCPDDLTIVLAHTYEHETNVEKSLRYLGIDDYVIVRPRTDIAWRSKNIFS